jgi:phosphoribosylaminoimidazole carboxylase PurK protein
MADESKSKIIGIVGGGQLGRMLTEAAHKLGFKVVVLDPTENSPAAQVADEHILGSFKDAEAIKALAAKVDVLTFEIESANAEALDELVAEGKKVFPEPKTLKIIKDKFEQKVFLRSAGIPVSDFALIESKDDIAEQGELFGYPFLLKTRFDAYDGRGNAVVADESAIDFAYEKLGGKSSLYAEKFVPFDRELAVVAARGQDGKVITYPVVETIHKNNICHIVISPAPVSDEIIEKARTLAGKVLDTLGGVGVFGIEMFLTKDGDVLINEIAPRVHNSGHHTIEGFTVSQFEAHIRAITGLELPEPEKTAPYSVMVNILGERSGLAEAQGIDKAHALGNTKVHLYGKYETRLERKMGHLTVIGNDREETVAKALEARKKISI